MQTYSFADVSLFVQGVEITGYDEGDDTIQLERLNDSASHIIGADGEMIVSLSTDRSGRVVFRLLANSPANTLMSGLITAQENGAFVPVFVQMKDNRNNDLGSGTQGYVLRPANISKGSKATAKEWEIIVERLDMLHLGG